MTRLPPPDRDQLDLPTSELLALASDAGGTPLLTVAVLAHQPPLVGPFLGWAAALALEGSLSKREHELLALRTATRCGSAFEWREHAGYARSAGLSDDEIARVEVGPGDPGWSEHDRLLLLAADELHDSHTISDETWTALTATHRPNELVEIVYVVGQYTMLSMVANAVEG